MANYSNFYEGAHYGFDPKYGEFLGMSYRTPVSEIGVATDPRTANQIKVVSEKLSTGAKAIEVQLAMPEVAESIPEPHLEELNRLRKITGVDFTVHGPLVEPTGVTRQGWDSSHREQAERQMWTALQRSRKLDPHGNVVVTFHSSNGLPEPETTVINEQTGKPETKNIFVVDERNGQFTQISPKIDYLTGKSADPLEELKRTNKDQWFKSLSQASFHAHQGKSSVTDSILRMKKDEIPEELENKNVDFYKLYKMSKTEDGQKFINDLSPNTKKFVESRINDLNYGEIYVRDAYGELQELFNRAYTSAKKDSPKDEKSREDLKKLDQFSKDIQGKLKDIENPEKISQLADEVVRGINVLNTITPPKLLKPLKDFAIDQASETFSNLAMRSWKEFKQDAPIISIENPPAGSGLNRAEDIKNLIVETRYKFVEKAKSQGLTENEAKKQAEKLIGATWDVGHINMIKKFGYNDEALEKETKKIAPYVKHVHLSDNFGMEHTELPMGMGNVPTKKHMEILDSYNKKLKKIIETGNWYQHFQTTPLPETFAAFGSPLYAMELGPAWNQVYGRLPGGYFAGYGFNPEIHHSLYGAGFSGLPVELGGQIPGRQSRLSGTPME